MPNEPASTTAGGLLAYLARQVIVPNATVRPRQMHPFEQQPAALGSDLPAVVPEEDAAAGVSVQVDSDPLGPVLRVVEAASVPRIAALPPDTKNMVAPRLAASLAVTRPVTSVHERDTEQPIRGTVPREDSTAEQTLPRQNAGKAKGQGAPNESVQVAPQSPLLSVEPAVAPAGKALAVKAATRKRATREQGDARSEVQPPAVAVPRVATHAVTALRSPVQQAGAPLVHHPRTTSLAQPDAVRASSLGTPPVADAPARVMPRPQKTSLAEPVVPLPAQHALPSHARDRAYNEQRAVAPVHVTIGRVEIRATPAASTTQPAKPRATPKPAMSLSEYLRARSEPR